MKKFVKILGLILILSGCTTRQGKENLLVSWYQFSLLAADSTGKVDTVYMDGVTADHVAKLPLISGDLIDVQKASIGYVYSSHGYLTREVIKSYFWGFLEEVEETPELLPIRRMIFKGILKGVQPNDPYMGIMDDQMEKERPR